ncbi:SRPBCC domain-containing protein [uncultured Tenacibaculum sp.]|uniref:SRPBCC domain-containing protein n=1 Tax=Tenacibaculum sp. ZS6-P6 TaxID=3447503 RepID=UPI00261B1740|nr:SRPBCC domain-containing protein [uncultured Tenacibaculum sp.]
MHTEITTSIHIKATPEKIWKVLLDSETYPSWNPFISSIVGVPQTGNTIEVNIGTMTFKPIILESNPNIELKWKGKLLFKGLFDGEHRFYLQDNNNGTTTFIQSEKFNGILILLFKKKIHTDVKNGFNSMNNALKSMVEER